MKKLVLIIFSISIFQWVAAQYCGFSDPSVCNSTGMPVTPGLYPPADSFPPFYNNFLSSATIQFRNFDTIIFGNQVLPVYSLKWDTIQNLPPNLCWSTNKVDNTFGRGEAGCIRLSGLACGLTGQYKLSTLVTVDIGVPVETDGDPGGLKYFVRLQNYGDTEIPVDTTQTDSVRFISYGGVCQSLSPPVVRLDADQTVCAGSIVTFNPVVTGGQPPYTYLWQSTGSTIICATCANASVAVTQDSKYRLRVTDAGGGFGIDSVSYTVTGTPYNFQITATQPDVFCAGGTVTISANANDSVSFQWYKNGNILTGLTGNTITVTDSTGAYNLVYVEPGVCKATSNIINLLFYDTTVITIVSSGSDTICVGEAVTLFANASGTGLNYAWLQGDINLSYAEPSLLALTAGQYRVIITNQQWCVDTSAAVLVVASPNFPTALTFEQFVSDTVCNNAAAIALAGGQPLGGYYTGNGVSNGQFDPSAARIGPNFVYYNYTDSTGCGSSVYDTVDVLLCTDVQQPTLNNGIHLYPNPVSGQLTVWSDIFLVGETQLAIYDVTGKKLSVNYQRRAIDMITVDVSFLATGCYSLQIIADGKIITKLFVKVD